MMGFKVWFGGDAGYRHVRNGQDENTVPVCPAFQQVGENLGPFDLALMPIGAYDPRQEMNSWHVSPNDGLGIFQDVRARKAVGMHWGYVASRSEGVRKKMTTTDITLRTWVLTSEPVIEPPSLLAHKAKKARLADDAFTICDLGETVIISA